MLTAQDLVLPHSVLIARNILSIIGMMLLDSLPDTDRTFTYSPFKEAGPVVALVLWICDCWTFVFMVPQFAREQGHRQSTGPILPHGKQPDRRLFNNGQPIPPSNSPGNTNDLFMRLRYAYSRVG